MQMQNVKTQPDQLSGVGWDDRRNPAHRLLHQHQHYLPYLVKKEKNANMRDMKLKEKDTGQAVDLQLHNAHRRRRWRCRRWTLACRHSGNRHRWRRTCRSRGSCRMPARRGFPCSPGSSRRSSCRTLTTRRHHTPAAAGRTAAAWALCR